MTFFLNFIFYNYFGDYMKKIIIIFILFGILISNINFNKKEKINDYEMRGVFISYIELNKYIKGNSYDISYKNINNIIKNVKDMKLNTIILQVRSSSDSIYNSKIFPYSLSIVNDEREKYFDVLDYFIKISHKNDIKVIAWINPYRIRTNNDISNITDLNPAYKYLNTDYVYINNGVFYNPSKEEVTKLIVDGVLEVLEYDVDGILFDDYFYPSDEIDINDYNEYKNNNDISLNDYHLMIINNMVKKVHEVCLKKNVPFGISPDGNIENNYNKNYADVRRWMVDNEYIDFIMPQLYYGFYNTTKGFFNVSNEWNNLVKNNIKLYIALAFYKVGYQDKYAREGINEWLDNGNIIMREIVISRNLDKYSGFSLFRYDSIFNVDNYTSNSIEEIENMKKVLK